jgi:hypothetical protein
VPIDSFVSQNVLMRPTNSDVFKVVVLVFWPVAAQHSEV